MHLSPSAYWAILFAVRAELREETAKVEQG